MLLLELKESLLHKTVENQNTGLDMAERYLAHYEGYLLDMAEQEGEDVQACLRRKEEIEKRTKRKR